MHISTEHLHIHSPAQRNLSSNRVMTLFHSCTLRATHFNHSLRQAELDTSKLFLTHAGCSTSTCSYASTFKQQQQLSFSWGAISQQWPHSDSASFSRAQDPRHGGNYITENTKQRQQRAQINTRSHTREQRTRKHRSTHQHSTFLQFTSFRVNASCLNYRSENTEMGASSSRHNAIDTNAALSSFPSLSLSHSTSNVRVCMLCLHACSHDLEGKKTTKGI